MLRRNAASTSDPSCFHKVEISEAYSWISPWKQAIDFTQDFGSRVSLKGFLQWRHILQMQASSGKHVLAYQLTYCAPVLQETQNWQRVNGNIQQQ